MAWTYERGEGRYKHVWKEVDAGFQANGSEFVAKCPSCITTELAEELLNNGFEVMDGDSPKYIFVFYEGVLYKAVPTRKGLSYHGYPTVEDDFRVYRKQFFEKFPELKKEVELWFRKAAKLVKQARQK